MARSLPQFGLTRSAIIALMTAPSAGASLFRAAFSHIGSQVRRPLAAVVVSVGFVAAPLLLVGASGLRRIFLAGDAESVAIAGRSVVVTEGNPDG